eukprot:15465416-Alexandrium_andersonii.AAC.1
MVVDPEGDGAWAATAITWSRGDCTEATTSRGLTTMGWMSIGLMYTGSLGSSVRESSVEIHN